jgi:cytochrome b561
MQNPHKYHLSLRILHWLMAFMILMMIAVGWRMTHLDKADPMRGTIYFYHKSFGATVLFLVVLRLGIRLITHAPALSSGISAFVRRIARGTQYIMYGLMFAIPIAGIAMSNMGGHGVSWFGIFELPKIFSDNKELGHLANEAHGYLAYTLLGFIALHVAGALKHRFFDKNKENDVIRSMV